MINWNDGLSIGVKDLDDDHKKILNTINTLSIAISNDEPKSVIDNIFNDLQEFTKLHFLREEIFLKKCDFPNIQERLEHHRTLIRKFPELRVKLSNSLNTENAQEVSYFLTDWLFNHIIEKDIPASPMLQKCGLSKEPEVKKSLFQQLLSKTTDTFSFTKRLFLLSVIPLFGMLIFGFILLLNDYTRYEEIKKTSNFTQLISDINELAHVLQIERGLSSGYISSSQNKFKKRLYKQRIIVNKSIESFQNKLFSVPNDKFLAINPFIETFTKDIDTLSAFRKKIDENKISQNDLIDFYTDIIVNILGITSKIAMFNHDKDISSSISSSISSLSSLLQFKESLGLKRAYGTIIIESKDLTTKEEYIKFIQISGSQNTLLKNFNHTASQAQKNRLSSIMNSEVCEKVHTIEKSIRNNDFKDLNSIIWFESMTQLINDIKIFEDNLIYEINILIKHTLEDGINDLFKMILYTGIIFLITVIIIYIFEKISKNEIFQLIDAMKHLARGERSFKLNSANTNNEMAKMYNAYETTRQQLLRGDMYTQLYLNKKELEIQRHQKQNIKLEKMAFIDPLTGTLNRRKFEEIANHEIERAKRYESDISFLMLDIDNFKIINDTHGHAIGDEILKHFSCVCLEMARGLDIVARIGGEEFVIMLPETTNDGAYIFAERLRQNIYSSDVEVEDQIIKYTVSIGISSSDADKDLKEILEKADKALYRAKESGRNRSLVYK